MLNKENEIIEWIGAASDVTERKQTEAAIAADLEDTQLLHDLSTRLTKETDIQVLYKEIVAAAIKLMRADAGTVQILDEVTQDLLLLATQGFDQTMTDHFYRVNASSKTPCGVALAMRERTFIDFDVPESQDQDDSKRMHVEAGYLSAQSTPLISLSGKPIGMLSTHWREHYRPSDRKLRFLDLLARQAANLIEKQQAQAALRESEEKYRTLFESINDGFCIIEMLYDNDNIPIDYRFIEVSPSFEAQTGLRQAKGKTMKELMPNIEADWIETYNNVVLTGEAVRFESQFKVVNRWFDVYAFPYGKKEDRQVTVVFTNISDRKQAEAEHLQRIQEQAAREKEHQRAEALAELDHVTLQVNVSL